MYLRILKKAFTGIACCLILSSCYKEFNCIDPEIHTAFIGFSISDLDTLVIRKYKANTNFQNLIDTLQLVYEKIGYYNIKNDTTYVSVSDGYNGMQVDYDWQLFIPALNKQVFVTDIISENKTYKKGIGTMCVSSPCINSIFSLKVNGTKVNYTNPDYWYKIYIHK